MSCEPIKGGSFRATFKTLTGRHTYALELAGILVNEYSFIRSEPAFAIFDGDLLRSIAACSD
jgi:hypothetical protein